MSTFLNSLLISSGTVIFSLVIGLPLALILAKTDIPFLKFLKYAYIIPIFIPPSIMALTWIGLCGTSKWLFSVFGSIVVLGFCCFPFLTLLVFEGLKAIGGNVEEAARVDRGPLGVIFHITLPYVFKYIVAGALFVFVFAVSNYEVPALLGIHTYPVLIFNEFSSFYSVKNALLLSMPLIIVTTLLIIAAARIMKGRDFISISQEWKKPWIVQLKKWQKFGAAIFSGSVIIISSLLPVIYLTYKTGSISVYAKSLQLSANEIGYSFMIGIIGTIVIVLLSLLIAYIIERSQMWIKHFLYYASILPFAIPATIVGVLLIKLFNRPFLNFVYTTPIILIVGYMVRFSPFAIRVLCANISQIERDIEDASKMEGASFRQTIIHLIIPLCRPGLIISLAVVFALIMGELGMTILVIPPGKSTLILKIYTLMHYGAGKIVAGTSIILILCVIILMGALMCFNRFLKRSFLMVIMLSFILNMNSLAEDNGHVYSTWDVIELDTCASAWLIKRYIDKKARFKFYPKGEIIVEGIAFDTPDAEFRRVHNMCTYETLLHKYGIQDDKAVYIGRLIHEIEINFWQAESNPKIIRFNDNVTAIIDLSKDPRECFRKAFQFFDRYNYKDQN